MMVMDMDRVIWNRARARARSIVYSSSLRRNVLISMLVVVVRLLLLLREWKEAVVLPRHDQAIKERNNHACEN